MNVTAVCRDVRPGDEAHADKVLLVAYAEDTPAAGTLVPVTHLLQDGDLSRIKAALTAQGLALGERTPGRPQRPGGTSLLVPIWLAALDDQGHEHSYLASIAEEYALSTGGRLYYLYLSEAEGALRWLVGKPLTLREVTRGTAQPA
jgi:hypothetical protein